MGRKRRKYDDTDELEYDYNERISRRNTPIEGVRTVGVAAMHTLKTIATGIVAMMVVFLTIVYAITGNLEGPSWLSIFTLLIGAVMTSAIWYFGRTKSDAETSKELGIIEQKLKNMRVEMKEMEERLQNVETIENLERKRTPSGSLHNKSRARSTTQENAETVIATSDAMPSEPEGM